MNKLIGAKMDEAKHKLKEIIKDMRKLALCVDGWKKRGLTASFMGVLSSTQRPGLGQAPMGSPLLAALMRHWMHGVWEKKRCYSLSQITAATSLKLCSCLGTVAKKKGGVHRLFTGSAGGAGSGLDKLWIESESEETGEEDKEIGQTGDLGE